MLQLAGTKFAEAERYLGKRRRQCRIQHVEAH